MLCFYRQIDYPKLLKSFYDFPLEVSLKNKILALLLGRTIEYYDKIISKIRILEYILKNWIFRFD
ncbi:hypothetical protein LEP1GSC188_2656 [Leptospira weilii serovar Topaz str. LT2116]|uniref:Uncharacterized protein n=1 Tax=Leptospira weilii serovar Topaz str. LT2116 TaxID=1088540 RepID=M3GWC0_9LEPT|nr:hypothetical protein LEP1GSC188_2656 [Leptospira weilii serovar Topaz str. LT2116]